MTDNSYHASVGIGADLGDSEMTSVSDRYVSIHADNLETVYEREWEGQYGFASAFRILKVTGGKLAGRFVYEREGFQWDGNTGGSRSAVSIFNEHTTADIVRLLAEFSESKDWETFEDAIYNEAFGYVDGLTATVRVID